MKRILFISLLTFISYYNSFSQCCGGCTPIGGNTNQGTLPKSTLQVNTYYKYGYSEGYTENDYRSDFKFVKNAFNSYSGLQVGYGVLNKLTVEAELGYYINRTQNFSIDNYKGTLNGYGFSSVTLGAKYSFYKDTARDIEITGGIGFRAPWTKQPQIVDGVELTEDVQPCNGAYGVVFRTFFFKAFDEKNVRIFMMNTATINSVNMKNYHEGNTYLSSFFFSKTRKRWSLILQLRNEIRSYATRDDIKVTSSGGTRFVFVPQINYNIYKKWNLSALYELPVYQYYNGIQLTDKYSFSINLNARFGLGKNADKCVSPK